MQCQVCKEEIKSGAQRCKHCHSYFIYMPYAVAKEVKSKSTPRVITLLISTIILLSWYIFVLKNPDFTLKDTENVSPLSQEDQNIHLENNK